MSETNTELNNSTTVTISGRIINKHDSEENWNESDFTPLLGETIVYDPDSTHPYPRYKTGIWDGVSEKTSNMIAKNLPFTDVIKSDQTTTVNVGGIAAGTSLKNKSITEIIEDIFFPYVPFTFSSISTTSSAGTKEYGTSVTISKVTPSFTAGSEAITSVKIGTTSGGNDLFEGTTATSGTAITLTENKTFDGTTGGTIYCTLSDGTTSTTKNTTVSYAYYTYAIASTNDALTAITSGATRANNTTMSTSITLFPITDSYIWFLLPPGTTGNKTIQYEALGQWYDFGGGTADPVDITLTLNTGVTATYKGYRTNKMAASAEIKYRIV